MDCRAHVAVAGLLVFRVRCCCYCGGRDLGRHGLAALSRGGSLADMESPFRVAFSGLCVYLVGHRAPAGKYLALAAAVNSPTHVSCMHNTNAHHTNGIWCQRWFFPLSLFAAHESVSRLWRGHSTATCSGNQLDEVCVLCVCKRELSITLCTPYMFQRFQRWGKGGDCTISHQRTSREKTEV